MLDASPYPFGVDGYYYPIQLRALLEHGSLQYPAAPLVFWLLAPFAAVTDPIVGAKLGAAVGGALVALPAYGIGSRLGKHRVAGLFAAAVAAVSASSEYMTTEFIKNSVGLTIGLCAVWLALRACERPTRGRIAAAIAGLVAAGLAHKMALALALAAAVPAALAEAHARGVLGRARLAVAIGVAVLGCAFAAAATGAFDQVGALWSATPVWDAPALAGHLVFDHEALIGGCVGLVVVALLVPRIRRMLGIALPMSAGERAVAIVAAAAAIAIACPWLAVDDAQGPGFRLRLIAFVPLALCAGIAVGAVIPKLGRDGWQIAAACALGLVILAPRARGEGVIGTAPELVAGCTALAGHIPEGATVVVAERHVEYMAAWYARATVTLHPETVGAAHRVRLLLPKSPATGGPALVRALELARSTPGVGPILELHPTIPDGLVLVSEPTWRWLLAHMPADASARFAAWHTI